MRDAYFVWGSRSAFFFTGGLACFSFGRLRGSLILAILKTKPKGNVQLDSPDSYCAMNKYFYELYEHTAIGELAFRKYA